MTTAKIEICYEYSEVKFRCPNCDSLNINGETPPICPDCGSAIEYPEITDCDCPKSSVIYSISTLDIEEIADGLDDIPQKRITPAVLEEVKRRLMKMDFADLSETIADIIRQTVEATIDS